MLFKKTRPHSAALAWTHSEAKADLEAEMLLPLPSEHGPMGDCYCMFILLCLTQRQTIASREDARSLNVLGVVANSNADLWIITHGPTR